MALFSSVRASLWLISNRAPSTDIIRDSIESPGCSLGVPGTEGPALLVPENESRCMRACLDARRFMSRRPTKSPRLKLPPPCLNSQSVESGEPVWKTSFTVNCVRKKSPVSHTKSSTFMKPIHVELTDERRYVSVLKILTIGLPVSY